MPPDYQQGTTIALLFIHVPADVVAELAYGAIAVCSLLSLVWRHPLADTAARAAAPFGALFTVLGLITGALWGKPMWGTYWVWDARLTSFLLLLFLYLGYIALAQGGEDRDRAGRIAAVFGLAGAINLPVIHYSVLWWRTLHQGPSITLKRSTIDSAILCPLPLAVLGFTLLFAGIVLMRMRADIARTRVEARLRRLAQS